MQLLTSRELAHDQILLPRVQQSSLWKITLAINLAEVSSYSYLGFYSTVLHHTKTIQ